LSIKFFWIAHCISPVIISCY